MLRRVVIGSIGVAVLVPTVSAATPVPAESKGLACPPPMKPSELPIYEAPHAEYGEYVKDQAKDNKKNYIQSALLVPVCAVREKAQVAWDHTASAKHTIQDKYDDLQHKSDWIVKYLREEDNKEVRYGAVAIGGLTGFIFGLRGGIIRRLLYSGLGTTGMGLVCFPEDTSQILKNNSAFAKQYINIAYNFLYGVKPGDPQLELKLPELTFPKDFSELTDMTMSLACTVYRAVMPPPSKDSTDSKPTDKKE